MKKIITTTMAVALVSAFAMAQDKPATAAAPKAATPATAAAATTAATDPIVIAAGDMTIRQSEFEGALATLPAEYQQYASGPGKRQFAEDYLRMKMLAAEGLKNGLDKDPQVLAQLDLMRENLVANAQIERLQKAVTVSDDELKKAYEAHKNEYEQVKARHILVAFKGSPAAQAGKPELTEEQAKAKAEDLRKQILAGANFDEIAKKESDDTGSGSRGGDLGAFGRGQMVPEFEQAAFSGKVGEVLPIVRSQFGYHIIKVDSHDTTSFDQVKANLEKAERQRKMQETLDAMKTKANAKYNDAYFGPATPAPTAGEAAPAPVKP
ncbi:MAG TPA: peptidylprolyl isomerase [Thermoanaerobaculia bacterium]|nr:peptidylprolyl isomerase [Thermoanaerobaculia bacterium]